MARRTIWSEKNIHLVFEVSLWLKGVFALLEIVAGIAAYLVTQQLLLSLVQWVTKDEFVEDPHDLVANYLLHSVQNLSISLRTGLSSSGLLSACCANDFGTTRSPWWCSGFLSSTSYIDFPSPTQYG
jgi:uncharacterized membrane protein